MSAQDNHTVLPFRRRQSPITYWGGKKTLASRISKIIDKIPHTTYVEPFFGGGAVYFFKSPSEVEVINDINNFVINFFKVCHSRFSELQKIIQETPFSRKEYDDALVVYQHPHLFDDVKKAWALWVTCNYGYGGKIGTWGYGTIDGKRETAIATKRDEFLEHFQRRLAHTQIENYDANRIIELRDRTTTFFYIDPPYIDSAQGHYEGYTQQHYEQLLTTLSKIKGKFLLSSYPSQILTDFIQRNGWHSVQSAMPTMSSKNRKIKHEVLTANFKFETPEKFG